MAPKTMTSVQVLAGPGMVARFGDVLLWLEEGGGGGAAVASRLLDLARSLAGDGEDEEIGAQVADALNRNPTAVPAMVLVTPTSDGIRAIVHGWGRVVTDDLDIDGGWADRRIPWTGALAAGRGGDVLQVPTPGSGLDLRRGSTPGGGAAVTLTQRGSRPGAGTAGAPRAAAPLPVPRPVPGAVAPPVAPSSAGPPPGAIPRFEPPVTPGAGGTAGDAPGVLVKGVVCREGHFNNPEALACRTCRLGLNQDGKVLRDGLRPPLGKLVLDDGTTFVLDRDHVVGSAPDTDPSVAGGDVRPVKVTDPSGQVARVHAEVRLVGWDVLLVALAPTFVLAPGALQWAPAPPAEPSPLPPGASVAVGPRTFTVAGGKRLGPRGDAPTPPPGPPTPPGRPSAG